MKGDAKGPLSDNLVWSSAMDLCVLWVKGAAAA
jgi:hypothetical protein